MCIANINMHVQSQENEPHDRSFFWLCTGSGMVATHMTAHFPAFVQVV
jgi:methylase of polypeptide subunit release factors